MMHALSAAEILDAWERGNGQTPAEQALTLLAAACPERTAAELAALPLGAREALLLTARERLFGGTLASFARCPSCAEALEFTVEAADLRTGPPTNDVWAASPQAFLATLPPAEPAGPSMQVSYRLPSGGDLVALKDVAELTLFRRALAERCVSAATCGGVTAAVGELSDDALVVLAGAMSAHDPQAETLLDLLCPACGGRWQAIFDIAAFFWTELTAEAKRLLREVDALARAYGWREDDILALSSWRRQMYRELAWTS